MVALYLALDTSEDVGISSRDLDNLRDHFLNNTDANPAVILTTRFPQYPES